MRDLFCGDTGTTIANLKDLQDALRVPYAAENIIGAAEFIGHSTSLSGRFVSPINPRVIMGSFDFPRWSDRAFLAFQRGEQQVEIATRDRGREGVNLYLLTFSQACNATPGGCLPGDLYTPTIENKWVQIELQDEEDLKNTPLDCRQCHERARQTPMLLMRELRDPWMHFFHEPLDIAFDVPGTDRPGTMALERAYERAKGTEAYANIPSSAMPVSNGFGLEGSVDREQPLLFDSQTIVLERFPFAAPPGSPPQRSSTWDREYEAFKLGEHLALPYFDSDATDPNKLATLTAAYQDFRAGRTTAAELPDISDIFPDDPHVRAQIGLQTEPDATAAEALIQACCSCHNDVLDQSISRARFNVALARLDPAELAVAIDRVARSPDDPGVMPPPAARQLDSAVRDRLVEYLEAANFSERDLDMLAHAAEAGMAGNVQ